MIWDLKNGHQDLRPMISVCQKRRLSWVLPFLARRSEPEIRQTPISSYLPKTETKSSKEKETAILNSDPHPDILQKTKKDVDCWVKQRPREDLRTQGRQAREASDLAPLEDNKDIAKNTPGFWWKKVLWKIFP